MAYTSNIKFSNNATSTIVSVISAVDTTIVLAAGTGAKFPSITGGQYFYATLSNAENTVHEVVKVTARSTDTLTVVRAQDGTSAAVWPGNSRIELRLPRKAINDLETQLSDYTDSAITALGTIGNMVGSNNLSEITNAATARTNLGLGTLATQSGTFSGTSSGTNTGDQTITLTGDVTGSGTGSFATSLAAASVDFSNIIDVATDTVLGRTTAGTGSVETITFANLITELGVDLKAPIASPTFTGFVTAPEFVATGQVGCETLVVTGNTTLGNSGTVTDSLLIHCPNTTFSQASNITFGSDSTFTLSGGANGLSIPNNSTGGTAFSFDAANGRLGIGTTGPAYDIDVVDTGLTDGTVQAVNFRLRQGAGGSITFQDGTTLSSATLGASATGVTTTGTATITADSDNNGSGDINFVTGITTQASISNAGIFTTKRLTATHGSSPNKGAIDIGSAGTSTNYYDANTQIWRIGDSTTESMRLDTTDFKIKTSKFTVVLASGNTSIAGTLGVTGATTLSAALTYGGVTLTNAVTGTGKMVLDTSPTLATPTIGVATATSINKVAITAPATSATLTIANGKTLTASNTLTFTGTDGSTFNIGTGGNLVDYATKASPTFTGTVVIPSPFTLGATSVTATGTELNYVSGVTSSIQSQLNLKAPLANPTFTGTVTTDVFTANGNVTLGNAVSDSVTLNGYLKYGTNALQLPYDITPSTVSAADTIISLQRSDSSASITKPMFYLEWSTNTAQIANPYTSLGSWGNLYKKTPAYFLVKAGASEGNEVNGLVVAVESSSPRFTSVSPILVGQSILANSEATTGTHPSTWGLNIQARASGASAKPAVIGGIEVDIVPDAGDSDGTDNYQYSAYWAAVDSTSGTAAANAGLVVRSPAGKWWYAVNADAKFKSYMGYFNNQEDAAGAAGLFVRTNRTSAGSDTNLLRLNNNGVDRVIIDTAGTGTIVGNWGFTGGVAITQTLGVTSDFAVNTNKFTVTAASGNTLVAGTLTVGNSAGITGTLAVTDDINVNTNKLTIDGPTGNLVSAGYVAATDLVSTNAYYQMAATTAPTAPGSGARLYVDTADGDLKVIFANGTVKTIATN